MSNSRYNKFTIKTGLADIHHFGNGKSFRTLGQDPILGRDGRPIKVRGEKIGSITQIFGGSGFQYDNGKVTRIGESIVHYEGNRIDSVSIGNSDHDGRFQYNNNGQIASIGTFEVVYYYDSNQIRSIGGEPVCYNVPSVYTNSSSSNVNYRTNEIEDDEREQSRIRQDKIIEYVTTICKNSDFWEDKIGCCGGVIVSPSYGESYKLPKGVSELLDIVSKPNEYISYSKIDLLGIHGAAYYRPNYGCFDQMFTGRYLATNDLYGILSQLNHKVDTDVPVLNRVLGALEYQFPWVKNNNRSYQTFKV